MNVSTLTFVYFLYGLAFFAMGLSVALESRWASALAFGHHLRWLAAFGLLHSAVEWSEMFLFILQPGPLYQAMLLVHALLLPFSTLLLVRFGIGLVGEAGPLPRLMTLVPAVLLVPTALLAAYVIILVSTDPHIELTTEIWSRYLLYLPGSLLASFGFCRQWSRLPRQEFSRARGMLLGAALAFLFNAVVAGLIVPQSPRQLIPLLSEEQLLAITGIPVQFWRMLSALTIAFFVVRALGIFKAERDQQIAALGRAHAEAQQRALQLQTIARRVAEEWTDGLVSVSRQIANIQDVDVVLSAITRLARQLLTSDTAALALWDDAGEHLELKCYAGADGEVAIEGVIIHTQIIVDTVRSTHPTRYPEDAPVGAGPWVSPITDQIIESAAIVPLKVDGKPIGGLWVARTNRKAFTETDLVGLERLSDQSVIALEHALMEARLQSLAVVEERARLAREMHDGLSQILGFLSLQMQTLEALVRQGDQEGTLAELKEARARIKAAQADVRENILSLRTTLAGDAGLLPALQQYVEEFGVQTGIQTQLLYDLDGRPRLSPLAETQLVRIVQEALANVRKHARARSVLVRLDERDGGLEISVQDDGVGFHASPDRQHFGLSTMRERAEDVGGTLQIASSLGDGTHVQLWLPLLGTNAMRAAAYAAARSE